MTKLEEMALELWRPGAAAEVNMHNFSILGSAFLEMRERHEAFRQEVSDAVGVSVKHFCQPSWTVGDRQKHIDLLSRFIIAKPDPLVEALDEIGVWGPDRIDRFRAAIEKRGGKLTWGEG